MRCIATVLVCLFLTVNYGCSVGMAMSGKNSPNLGLIRVGASRGEVELTLGPPIKTTSIDADRRIDIYKYEVGNESSAGRAAGHAVMDLLTLGLWEIVGTPIEGFQGEEHNLSIAYGKDDKVISINSIAPVVVAKPTLDKSSYDLGTESC
jgi:hypothetical protein